jgi:ribosomal protein L13
MLPFRCWILQRRAKNTNLTGACKSCKIQWTNTQYRKGLLQKPHAVQYMDKKMQQGIDINMPDMLPKNITTLINHAASSG